LLHVGAGAGDGMTPLASFGVVRSGSRRRAKRRRQSLLDLGRLGRRREQPAQHGPPKRRAGAFRRSAKASHCPAFELRLSLEAHVQDPRDLAATEAAADPDSGPQLQYLFLLLRNHRQAALMTLYQLA
jgi:hypothetical protein